MLLYDILYAYLTNNFILWQVSQHSPGFFIGNLQSTDGHLTGKHSIWPRWKCKIRIFVNEFFFLILYYNDTY